VVDNTHFTINGAGGYWQISVSLSGSMTIQKIGSDLGGYALAAQPAASWNYYEALLGGIRLAAATNLDLYNNQSQAFCNLWWQYGLDHGYRGTIPRNSGYHSMIACAVKYGFNWWDGIAKVIGPPNLRQWAATGFDIRETSYSTRATALMAHLYPPHSANQPATAAWCRYLTNQAQLLAESIDQRRNSHHRQWTRTFPRKICTELRFPPPGPAGAVARPPLEPLLAR
jgi:hypothetical protein